MIELGTKWFWALRASLSRPDCFLSNLGNVRFVRFVKIIGAQRTNGLQTFLLTKKLARKGPKARRRASAYKRNKTGTLAEAAIAAAIPCFGYLRVINKYKHFY
jgi:hypothetical protein